MARTPTTLLAAATAAVLLTACRSATAPDRGQQVLLDSLGAQAVAEQSSAQAADASRSAEFAAAVAPDPCQVLTMADVQPFFTDHVMTAYPQQLTGRPDQHTCEWTDVAGAAITMSAEAGEMAQTRWFPATQPGYDGVFFSGVGDRAEHTKGAFDLVAIIGAAEHPTIACGITETGKDTLVLNKDIDVGTASDAADTAAALEYGSLCNKLFGSTYAGRLPTTLSARPTGVVPVVPPNTLTDAGTIPKSRFPLPNGVSCGENRTTSDGPGGGLDCSTTSTDDPGAVFSYFLSALPRAGYTLTGSSQRPGQDGTATVYTIRFQGPDAGWTSNILVLGPKITISLAALN